MPLSWGSFRLWRAFGVTVRADFSLLLFGAVFLAVEAFRGVDPVLLGGLLAILLVSVLLHEIGHCLAARAVGGGADEIVLWPLGGFSITTLPSRPLAHFWTAFGGPLATSLLAAALAVCLLADASLTLAGLRSWAPGRSLDTFLMCALQINLILLVLNLLPGFPLDGGLMLRAALWPRLGSARAGLVSVRCGYAVAVLLAVLGWQWRSLWLMVIAFLNFMLCYREQALLASGAGGEDALFDREIAASASGREEGPGWLERRRLARREREASGRREREAGLRARLDVLLERIHRVGMQGLTDEERAVLKEASDLFRHSRK